MAELIYYRDEDEERGPFNEKTVLEMYNGAEFTSDFTFQIRSSASDTSAPFVLLRDLMSKNGPSNPFRDDFIDLDKRIADAEKELAELRYVHSKKAELEQRVAEIEKDIEERKKQKEEESKQIKSDSKPIETSSSSTVKTPEEIQKGIDYLKNQYGASVSVQPFSADSMDGDDKSARLYRRSLLEQNEKTPGMMCMSCNLFFANWKQFLLHINLSCPNGIQKELKAKFEADIPRWKKEDADRLSLSRHLFSRMNSDEKGRARPQTDFIEDINMRLKKEMDLNTNQGIMRSVQFLPTEAATKVKDRLEKHLKEAKGFLVCNKCEVACRTHLHFRIHLTTYEHRMKVRGSSFELISVLLGWFNRGLYLKEIDSSEIDENEECGPDWVMLENAKPAVVMGCL